MPCRTPRRTRARPRVRPRSVERDAVSRVRLSRARPWLRCGRWPTMTAAAPMPRRSKRTEQRSRLAGRVMMNVEKNASSIRVAMPPAAGTTTSRTAAANSGSGTSRAAEAGLGTPSCWNERRVASGARALAARGDHEQRREHERGGVAEAPERHVRQQPHGWRPWWRSAGRVRGERRATAGRRPRPSVEQFATPERLRQLDVALDPPAQLLERIVVGADHLDQVVVDPGDHPLDLGVPHERLTAGHAGAEVVRRCGPAR